MSTCWPSNCFARSRSLQWGLIGWGSVVAGMDMVGARGHSRKRGMPNCLREDLEHQSRIIGSGTMGRG